MDDKVQRFEILGQLNTAPNDDTPKIWRQDEFKMPRFSFLEKSTNIAYILTSIHLIFRV